MKLQDAINEYNRPITQKDIDDAVKAFDKHPETHEFFYVPKSFETKLVEFTAAEYLRYKSMPWYRKIIYKWNMWRIKV